MKRIFNLVALCALAIFGAGVTQGAFAQRALNKYLGKTSTSVTVKSEGRSSQTFGVEFGKNGLGTATSNAPFIINRKIEKGEAGAQRYAFEIEAKQDINFSLRNEWIFDGLSFDESLFYMPGFWYKRNERTPKNAPSLNVSDNWSVRDDRLTTPLAGFFQAGKSLGMFVRRTDKLADDVIMDKKEGEVILNGNSSIGSVGFAKSGNQPVLTAQYPFHEAPYSYQTKLKLTPALRGFVSLKKGEKKTISWEVKAVPAKDYTEYVSKTWEHSFDNLDPQPLEEYLTDTEIKETLTNFHKEAIYTVNGLTGFSGLWYNMATCENTGVLSVGFCGRTLINSFNLLEFGDQQNDPDKVALARKVIDSYFDNGFTESGLLREQVYRNYKETVYSLRKQTEGIVATLYILNYDRLRGKRHPEVDAKIKGLLKSFAKMQDTDGSLPRKFDRQFKVLDKSKGSTQLIITPMLLASKYFDDPEFKDVAVKASRFIEKELVGKADYFSSTLDSNCEDKEAALIASTSLLQLAQVSEGKEKQRYIELMEKSAVFTLSWYYLYDVPFAQGQLLYGANLKTRGWGSVSTENNHIDVYIFDFLEVLRWLEAEKGNKRYGQMADVIESSIREQMLPYEYHMRGVGKKGYMPEIVQQTMWDYGANGKGFLNVHGSIGWTVASVWEMLSPGRFDNFMNSFEGN
ncbi:hypothetical protein FUAX_43060 (plasmid) [Fulvitalea axinellae]|uniref:Uncharacterized protein n=1 Tax=Fulvitalea axinellae TaxID=1182444 RepID=A0AAU9CZD5_9BACT|nr:hypothetical protein FUAX_43060 [Fulvitalea axinellae]